MSGRQLTWYTIYRNQTMARPSWKDNLALRIKKALGMNVFLCSTCKWDWRAACHNPERPGATYCADYEKRGK